MTRLVRSALGAAVVVLACSATASAQAPEFGRCVKQIAVEKAYHGKYRDAKCTKAVTPEEEAKKGRFEWEPGPGPSNGFTTTGGTMTIVNESGKTMVCTSEASSGEFVPGADNKELTTVLIFRGCRGGGGRCTTLPRSVEDEGEVETIPLVGEVNWEDKATKHVALALKPAPGYEGMSIIKVKCDFGIQVEWRGGLLVPIKTDKMTSANELKYSANGQGQKPHVWHVGEGSEEMVNLEMSWERFPFERTRFSLETTMTAEEPLELNAVL